MKDPIQIILVDDHQLVLDSWKTLLEQDSRLKVVACCRDSTSAIEKTIEINPDILLLDIKMRPLTGFEVTKRLLTKIPDLKIIGLSVNNQPNYAHRMMENGARGYLTKTSSLDEICHGIKEVFEGKKYVCKEIEDQEKV